MTATKTPNTPAIAASFHDANGVECGITENPASMRLTFADGRTQSLSSMDILKMTTTLAWHGAKQKLVDAAAVSRNPETGRSATIEDKFTAVDEVRQRLLAGEWNKTREGVATGGLLLSALVRMYGGTKTREQVEAFLATKTDAEKTALRGNSRVAVHIEAIKAERATTTGVDASALLDAFDAE